MSVAKDKEKSSRNRTLLVEAHEQAALKKRLLVPTVQRPYKLNELVDKTIKADTTALLPYLPKQFADLIFIDPPYNLDKDFDGLKFKAQSNDQYLDYLRSWMPQVVSLLKPNGSLYLCGDWKCTAVLHQVMEENLAVLNRITWQREKGRGAQANWKNSMEDIWFGVKNKSDYYFNVQAVKMKRKVVAPYKIDVKPKDWEATKDGNFRLTHPSNFWDDLSVPYWSMPENTEHPTQKPEKLLAKIILASCPEGGIVFDPFLGSGTTSVVAKKLGRKYVGIEANENFCLMAEKRLTLAANDPSIQGYTDGVFWERNTLSQQKKGKQPKLDE